jgi:alpha-1,6-mannosyltransferase
VKICDLTQFYSPVSGGVKRYVSEKVRHVRERTAGDEHVLIIPGGRDEMIETERARTYTIQSPLISRTSRYRALLRLEAVERILEKERPDIIECGDPYQVAWKAVHSGAALGIPVVGFYHSHFPEAYIRTVQKFCGRTVTEFCHDLSRRYIRSLYNRFERTLVPSPALGGLLAEWGVQNIAHTDLGVDTAAFHPQPAPGENMRAQLGIPRDRTLLLYVGRLAQEKNTHTLFAAFRLLARDFPSRFHLLVIGDGLQRSELSTLNSQLSPQHHGLLAEPRISTSSLTHLPYCSDAAQLAAHYRAADIFVHPGVQETFGLVTLEAQACGTPVVGIRGSYMDRIIHSDQTLWARENSPAALAVAIEETSRADLKASNARVSALVAAQYSWCEVFTKLFALYGEVIGEHRVAR